jgi:hypothetical protein
MGWLKGTEKLCEQRMAMLVLSDLSFLVGVPVHDGEVVVVILLADEAAGILAEGADLVLEGLAGSR